MKVGVIGGGSVGQTMAEGLAARGHDVRLGIRSVTPEDLAKDRGHAPRLSDWQARTGIAIVTMDRAAAHGEVVLNATQGAASLAALTLAGAGNLSGKVLVDIANPLDFAHGMPPFLMPAYAQGQSLGEAIQAAFPQARVVKAFNTVAAAVMVNPASIPGDHDLFIAGNDAAAKGTVSDLARGFGWSSIVDLGGIAGARASEAILPLWITLWGVLGTPTFNLRAVRAPAQGPA
jgi:8-hydroxy-5-deazaflavin:NADPH oxidoreductase